jgi:hypothetical protein
MSDQKTSLFDRTRAAISEAMRLTLTDHFLIRACVARQKDANKIHGLVPPPPKGVTYGPSILVKWAHKVVERCHLKPFRIGGYTNYSFSDHLFSFGLRMLGFLGSWGVPLVCALIGLFSGLAFLPMRIFTATQVTLIQILIPVLLGVFFVGKQVLNMLLYFASLLRRRTRADGPAETNEGLGLDMLSVARRILPAYFRLNLNLAGCVFWLVVLSSMGLEYIRHHEANTSYVYRSQYMPLQERLVWLNRFSRFIPNVFRLPDECLAWADQDYRDGYRLIKPSIPSALTVNANSSFLLAHEKVELSYDPDPQTNILGAVLRADDSRTYLGVPFKQQITAKTLYTSPVDLVAIIDTHGRSNLEVTATSSQLTIHAKNQLETPRTTFLIDGVIAATNVSEYVISLDASLPNKIQLRKESDPTASMYSLAFVPQEHSYAISQLAEPVGYARHWFLFLLGVILTFGLAPRIIALPIFGVLYATRKWTLYREFHGEPFASIIADTNKRPTSSIYVEPKIYHDGPLPPKPASPDIAKLPYHDVLAVGYNTRITDADVRQMGGASDFLRYDRPAGDANTNIEVLDWLDKHESFGRFILCLKLTATPDRPLIRFLQEAISRGFSCELAFLDMPENHGSDDHRLAIRVRVWRDTMEKAGLLEILPETLRNSGTTRGKHE